MPIAAPTCPAERARGGRRTRCPVGKPFGDLCVHALSDGEDGESYAWEFSGENLVVVDSFRSNCAAFYDAVPGAKITAKLGGTATDFVILPAL